MRIHTHPDGDNETAWNTNLCNGHGNCVREWCLSDKSEITQLERGVK